MTINFNTELEAISEIMASSNKTSFDDLDNKEKIELGMAFFAASSEVLKGTIIKKSTTLANLISKKIVKDFYPEHDEKNYKTDESFLQFMEKDLKLEIAYYFKDSISDLLRFFKKRLDESMNINKEIKKEEKIKLNS